MRNLLNNTEVVAILFVAFSFVAIAPLFNTLKAAYAEHSSPDYPLCKILCVEQIGSAVFQVYYNINRDLDGVDYAQLSSKVTPDFERNSIIFDIESPVNGTINITLYGVLAAEKDGKMINYTVLLDGKSDDVVFRELDQADVYREFERVEYVARHTYLGKSNILSIQFPAGAHTIEILGTEIIQCEGICDVFPYSQYECHSSCSYDLKIGDKIYPIAYGLYGELSGESNSAKLISITAATERKAIIANIETAGFGTFRAFLPRYVIQSANDSGETDFTVLIDGKQVDFDEFKSEPIEPFRYRILTIDFDKGAKKIEIIGTWMNDGRDFSDPDPYFPCGSLEQNCTIVLQAAGNNKTLPLKYAIWGDEKTGVKEFPKIEKIYVYTISDSLFFYVESPYQGGHLVLELPPEVFQFNYGSDLLIAGAMNHTNVVRKDAQMIDIQFDKGSQEIEVSGISLFKEGEEVMAPPDFPCARKECVYNNVAGANSATYDVRYHIYGWPNFGYPDNVRVNWISIDHSNKSLVVNVTAEQPGRMDVILEEEVMTNELEGSKGINYVVHVDGKQMDTAWPGPNYFPDKKERVASFDLPRGARQVEIVGVPVERCNEHGYNELEFCLYEVNIDGSLYPLLIRYSPDQPTDPDANAYISINNVTVNEERKSIIFDLTASHRSFVHFIPTKEMIDAEDYLQAYVNGKVDSGSDNLEGQNNVWFFVPKGNSRVEIIGTSVLPEFTSALAAATTALGIMGAIALWGYRYPR